VKIPSRFTDEGNVAAVQVGNDTVEVIGDEGASGASLALFGNAVSVAEHEVIDEELRASAKEVPWCGASLVGLESIVLVDPNPRQLLPSSRQLVAAPHEFLFSLQQLEPCREPTPTLYHSASECALKVRMVCGVAPIAERNQVRRFIDSTGGPRDQVVNVGFAPGTRVTARPANVAVSSKYNISDLAPSLVLLSHRIVEHDDLSGTSDGSLR
jgi:hypothetical protein